MTFMVSIWRILLKNRLFQGPRAIWTTENWECTLLNKGSIDNPDGTVQGGRGRGSWLGSALSPHSLYPVQHEYEHTDHRDGGGDAGPHCEIKGGEEGEDADFLLGFLDQDPNRVVHVALAEVHNALPLWGDGDSRDGQVCSLKDKEVRKR